jgi:hypothetical protein
MIFTYLPILHWSQKLDQDLSNLPVPGRRPPLHIQINEKYIVNIIYRFANEVIKDATIRLSPIKLLLW